MTNVPGLREKIETLARERNRFAAEVYFFTQAALDYVLTRRNKKGLSGHIGGAELLEGIKDLAAETFGYLGRAVFESWGLVSSADFGVIVFDLVEAEVLSKQETDTQADFEGGFEFGPAFESKFIHE